VRGCGCVLVETWWCRLGRIHAGSLIYVRDMLTVGCFVRCRGYAPGNGVSSSASLTHINLLAGVACYRINSAFVEGVGVWCRGGGCFH
jgi:hypothetical protein